uniref:Succinate dehydrogenase assembly factor 4, mitochondrial n=1 Tax=Mycena chlorophos TaxID=658473 RepID=A0ABQ0M029_MYCCL|nr:predicted protein [Mycena chlorophos]
MHRVLRFRPLSTFSRPAPIPLPREQQREFEQLQRAATTTATNEQLEMHPDARQPLKPDFEGDENPLTGEKGGPKQEPVKHYIEGDWSFKGRVSDF